MVKPTMKKLHCFTLCVITFATAFLLSGCSQRFFASPEEVGREIVQGYIDEYNEAAKDHFLSDLQMEISTSFIEEDTTTAPDGYEVKHICYVVGFSETSKLSDYIFKEEDARRDSGGEVYWDYFHLSQEYIDRALIIYNALVEAFPENEVFCDRKCHDTFKLRGVEYGVTVSCPDSSLDFLVYDTEGNLYILHDYSTDQEVVMFDGPEQCRFHVVDDTVLLDKEYRALNNPDKSQTSGTNKEKSSWNPSRYRVSSSSSNSNSHRVDPDVADYDDPDDFADVFADEFGGYDDAYEYWEDEY